MSAEIFQARLEQHRANVSPARDRFCEGIQKVQPVVARYILKTVTSPSKFRLSVMKITQVQEHGPREFLRFPPNWNSSK